MHVNDLIRCSALQHSLNIPLLVKYIGLTTKPRKANHSQEN